jgi:hypothetical protein
MYTMVPEDYLKFWADENRRGARGWTPAPAKPASRVTRTRPGWLRRPGVAARSVPLHS